MSLDEIKWIELPHVPDERGILTSIESGLDIPFPIERVFFMHSVRGERGGHAHRATRQLLIPIAGEFELEVHDGRDSDIYRMRDRNRGLYLPPMTWVRLFDFAPHAVCLVLADTRYAHSAYIRDWNEFLALAQHGRAA
jgi:hypothetical protein